ncbi:MAG: tryptophan synthase subunit alpha, partial [Opitutae bacterium]|nr:tryptophan synthase subunit alpha [Opitutae bacterium]
VGEVADGVVVGSALVNCIPKNIESLDRISTEIGDKARELSQGLRSLSS